MLGGDRRFKTLHKKKSHLMIFCYLKKRNKHKKNDFLSAGYLTHSSYIDLICSTLHEIILINIRRMLQIPKMVDGFPLFRNERFMLDEMFQRNASKFAIFLEYEHPAM